ncbi:hypothetical protein BST81_03135 [Leptolyngbya sp. 'hensonii']|uniref:hypothetical protein n=1 Tax=Leptolyngbya sp. 'hensonii' TaxID=1922337 RepID=UPI00094FADA7|nr:hypothetical protein [Leptolyngbya sp. 'hensonii']OLP19900.1 hypothetical protein BST81_03135 [Leptolyngbya sp. 'hensonii']
MLVILTSDQLIPPERVCQTCLLADRTGHPRWHQGRLWCGHALHGRQENLPEQYECQMGFRIARID